MVVLIIGVLTAVALPQYTKAVEKARATEALSITNSIVNAVETTILSSGVSNGDIYTDPENNSYHSAYILDEFIASGYGAKTEIERDNLSYISNTYVGLIDKVDKKLDKSDAEKTYITKDDLPKEVWLTAAEWASTKPEENVTYNIYEEASSIQVISDEN